MNGRSGIFWNLDGGEYVAPIFSRSPNLGDITVHWPHVAFSGGSSSPDVGGYFFGDVGEGTAFERSLWNLVHTAYAAVW